MDKMLVLCDNQSHQNYRSGLRKGKETWIPEEGIPYTKKIANVYYPNSVQNFLVLKCIISFEKS